MMMISEYFKLFLQASGSNILEKAQMCKVLMCVCVFVSHNQDILLSNHFSQPIWLKEFGPWILLLFSLANLSFSSLLICLTFKGFSLIPVKSFNTEHD